MKQLHAVPTDPSAIAAWSKDFADVYGFPPIAGGETPTADPPAPPQPAAPAGPEPATPPATPGEPQPAPAEPANTPEVQDFAKDLIGRLDELAPPAPVDPLAVELGFQDPPLQPPSGQQVTSPQPPAAGPGLPGTYPNPGQAAVPGQVPQQPVPGQPQADPNEELVNRLIDDRAEQVAARMLEQRVAPYFQQQEANRRRAEAQSLLEDYPELKDEGRRNQLISQARTWAIQTEGNAAKAAEPGYLEIVHLAMKGMDASQREVAPAPATPGGEVPIEGNGGASPAPALSDSQQVAQAIVDAKPGGGLDPLWI